MLSEFPAIVGWEAIVQFAQVLLCVIKFYA